MEETLMTIEYYKRLFAYDAWGNRAVLDSLRLATLSPSSRACAILAHLVGAGRIWLDRIHGRAAVAEVWPKLSFDECEAGFRELDAAWTASLEGMKQDDLARRVTYFNSRGERWESIRGDILTHVILHGTYHRGQIAVLVREAGHAPAYTDFIEATRRGFLESR
jgi:uncharacterized damage-inducible protein DinB